MTNKPVIAFLGNFYRNEIISYGNFNNTVLNYPSNNMVRGDTGNWIYGGWFVVANGNIDQICVKGNNGIFKRQDKDNFKLNYICMDPDDKNDHIIISNILYYDKNVFLINVNKASVRDVENKDYFNYLGIILSYIKNEIVGDNYFIICGETGLNGKYIDLAIKTVFDDSVISSCYDGIITFGSQTSFTQSIFIIIKKELCQNGVRFGIRYLENEPVNYNLLLYANIYNEKYKGENNFYTDPITLNILESIKSRDNYIDRYINWDNIDTSQLDTNFTYSDTTFVEDTLKATKQKLDTLLNDQQY